MAYKSGDHWVICDICGLKRRRSRIRKNHQGMMVCADTCWEPRHPQENIRIRQDRIAVTDPRPRQTATYLEVGDVTADDL